METYGQSMDKTPARRLLVQLNPGTQTSRTRIPSEGLVSILTLPQVIHQTMTLLVFSRRLVRLPPLPKTNSPQPLKAQFRNRERRWTVRTMDQAGEAVDIAVSQPQVSAENNSDRECIICADTKPPLDFPQTSVTATCNHPPEACLECMRMSIKTDLDTKIWTEIQCPECPATLEYADVQQYADEETFSRFEELVLRAAMSQAENFVWCTAGCGSGQIHESSTRHPIVTCLHCGHRSCFQHGVAWHEALTCKEYDRLLADPENFRSRWENDDASEVHQRHQVDADGAVARGLVAGEETARWRRHFKRKQAEDRRRLEAAAARAREAAIKRKKDEERTAMTIGRTTKACPGCGSSIEKKGGCSHMTCE
ncbi:uncharacterized protein DNG_06025 [Cephalotrichum gorgonifer]|uniref:RBR-type E3 ubiquitin transferase n=1 Tax=Cephalotrichum gorgonifer TaxID=2041049 RepID=A0AAE8SW25_9PEZI|nr:uncharacterized protein DNG_06025 [Cephalotrichum gorgonifer]